VTPEQIEQLSKLQREVRLSRTALNRALTDLEMFLDKLVGRDVADKPEHPQEAS